MIEFKNVSAGYEKKHQVLKNVSFSIEEGDCVGLIGANGAGKSTLMKVLFGLLPFEGEVSVAGTKVCRENLSEIRKKAGWVLQNSDNQMFMSTVHDDMVFGPMNYGLSREEAEKKIDQVLEKMNISDLKDKYNHKISGGEKRMAAIATVLAMDPEVLVMDEPSSSLDPYNRRIIINTIKDMTQTRLIASHDLDMILETCNKVILISNGEIVADGPAEKILSDKELLMANRLELPLCMMNK